MIHPTAIIHPGARLAADVAIGPYSIIGEHVTLGEGCWVGPHAVVEGRTTIGRNNRIFQFSSIGAIPQDLKFRGEETTLSIGDGNTFREFVTVHLGTADGGGITTIGNKNLLMAYVHVAHDCIVGNEIVLANAATLAGHVEIGDHAILGGLSAIHQFTRIGIHAMISGGSMVNQDITPYTIAQGDRAQPVGINLIGLKRRGFSDEALRALRNAYKTIFRAGLKQEEALEKLTEDAAAYPEVKVFVDFIRGTQRGIAR
jgi:UDP-N-acetylglucosamine acyltransferase